MKKLFTLLLLITSITSPIFSSNSFKSISNPNLEEAIIAIPEISGKNFYEIKTALSNIDGVTIIGYCEQHKCFLLNYDTKKIESADQIARSIEALNPRYKTEIKVGTSISQIIDSCTKYSSQPIDQAK